MQNNNATKSVSCIVVTYQPELDRIQTLLDATRPQVDHLVVIDNGSNETALPALRRSSAEYQCTLVELGANLGLAAAMNRGIQWAQQQNSTHVLFLDQDSVPMPEMVDGLLAALEKLEANQQLIAGVGPVVVDPRLGAPSPFVIFTPLGLKRRQCDGVTSAKILPSDFLISSGMLAPITVFDQVGLFDDGLFIDNVDLEWCFRAATKGFKCYGVCGAELEHYLGDEVDRIWLGRWFPIYRHSPIRQYYIMRNRILLYKKRYSPMSWILQDICRALFKFVMFSIFYPNRIQNLRMMLAGLSDGLAGRVGKYSEESTDS